MYIKSEPYLDQKGLIVQYFYYFFVGANVAHLIRSKWHLLEGAVQASILLIMMLF